MGVSNFSAAFLVSIIPDMPVKGGVYLTTATRFFSMMARQTIASKKYEPPKAARLHTQLTGVLDSVMNARFTPKAPATVTGAVPAMERAAPKCACPPTFLQAELEESAYFEDLGRCAQVNRHQALEFDKLQHRAWARERA